MVPHTESLCSVHAAEAPHARERGVLLVVLLTAAMMVVEIGVGYATHSMALLADGWHMATHVGALGLASAAYAFSRRYASHQAFVFGTGKVRALAGYTSAVLLGLIAVLMVFESVGRLLWPTQIDFATSLPVAVVGLLVNLASVLLLHVHDEHEHDHPPHAHHDDDHDPNGHGHAHAHDHASEYQDHAYHSHHQNSHPPHDLPAHTQRAAVHDHNHHAALMHVVADALTSGLAIAALLAGRYLQWTWLDAASGVVGGAVILQWGVSISRHAAYELLDVLPERNLESDIRRTLEQVGGARVLDLHVWSLGGARISCIASLSSETPRDVTAYKAALAPFKLAHLTIEVQRHSRGLHTQESV